MNNQSKPFSFEGKKTTTAKAGPVDEHGNLPVVHVVIKRPKEVIFTIGLFFDGTANNSYNSQIRKNYQQALTHGSNPPKPKNVNHTSYENEDTNVHKLFEMYDISEKLKTQSNNAILFQYQQRLYIEGAGTEIGEPDSNIGMGSGLGSTGIHAKVAKAIIEIKTLLKGFFYTNKKVRIQKLQFDIFGFSRGAATARFFANLVANTLSDDKFCDDNNPLTKMLSQTLDGVRSPHWQGGLNGEVRFLGIFDTVAGLASIRNLYDAGDGNTFDIDISIKPKTAQHGLQIQAAHEYRENFSLNDVPPFFKRIIAPGAHSDIGGGYSNNPVTEDLYLTPIYYQEFDKGPPVQRDLPYRIVLSWLDTRLTRLHRHPELSYLFDGLNRDSHFQFWEEERNATNDSGSDKIRLNGVIRFQRTVKSGLDRIALRMMYDEAVGNGCKFNDFNPDYAIPAEILPIADKILKAAKEGAHYILQPKEKALILGHYVHCSAEFGQIFVEHLGELEIIQESSGEVKIIPWRELIAKDNARATTLKVHKPCINSSGLWERTIHPNAGD